MMIKSRFAVAGAAALAVVALGAAQASAGAKPAPKGWNFVATVPTTGTVPISNLTAIDALAGYNAWAVGTETMAQQDSQTSVPLVEHWNGHAWGQLVAPKPPSGTRDAGLTEISSSDKNNIWVAGTTDYPGSLGTGAYLAQWNGKRWTTVRLGEGWTIGHLAVFAPNNVWALGSVDGAARFAHWNGRHWTIGTLPGTPTSQGAETVSPAWAPAADPKTGQGVLLHWNGHGWVRASAPRVALPTGAQTYAFNDVLVTGPRDTWVTVGYSAGDTPAPGLGLWHSDGKHWQHVLELKGDIPLSSTTDGGHGLWLESVGGADGDVLVHVVNGKVVARVAAPKAGSVPLEIETIARIPSSTAVWAAGELVGPSRSSAAIARYLP